MKASSPNQSRIVVVGCGGIGGVLSASLHQDGVPLCIATTNEAVREVWTSTGPRLGGKTAGGPLSPSCIRDRASDFPDLFEFAFVAVQPPQIEAVCHDLKGQLTENGRIICLSNGLCEERMSAIIGEERVIGAVVAWGARMKQPGHYVRTSKGGFRLGKLTAKPDAQLRPVAEILEHVGKVALTDNLRGARLSKLTINCAVTALGAIGGKTLGELLVRSRPRHLALNLMREAALVARAEGVTLEPVTKVDLAKLAAGKRAHHKLSQAAQHALLLAVGARYRKLRSSMLAAMERGRSPAIDYINGEIVTRGKQHGVATPYNEAAIEVVWAIYRGELVPGHKALRRVNDLAQARTF